MAECTLCFCPIKAGSWPGMWRHKACHCLLCDIEWGESIENSNSTTQGNLVVFVAINCSYFLPPDFWVSVSVECRMPSKSSWYKIVWNACSVWWASWIVVTPLEALTGVLVPLRNAASNVNLYTLSSFYFQVLHCEKTFGVNINTKFRMNDSRNSSYNLVIVLCLLH